jgi:hypothetical protein
MGTGEDLSLVELKTVEYQGSKQVVASDEIRQQIVKTGIRELERETRVSHHTLEKVLKGETIRRKTLAKVVKLHELSRFAADAFACCGADGRGDLS